MVELCKATIRQDMNFDALRQHRWDDLHKVLSELLGLVCDNDHIIFGLDTRALALCIVAFDEHAHEHEISASVLQKEVLGPCRWAVQIP